MHCGLQNVVYKCLKLIFTLNFYDLQPRLNSDSGFDTLNTLTSVFSENIGKERSKMEYNVN